MLEVDFHAHTLFSSCGLHTIVEMLTRARELGMAALALTDHGPAVGGRQTQAFFDRLSQPVPGVRLLKGIEANVLPGRPGATDVLPRQLPYCDVVLVGLHSNVPLGGTPGEYTDMLVAALEANPFIDVVTHPNGKGFPLELPRLAQAARDLGRALELNNSKVALSRTDLDVTRSLLRVCRDVGCPVVVSSDAHALNEVGSDEAIRALMGEEGFPEDLVLNRTAATAFEFLESRRGFKRVGD